MFMNTNAHNPFKEINCQFLNPKNVVVKKSFTFVYVKFFNHF